MRSGQGGIELICVSAAPSDAMLSDRLLCSHHQDDEHTVDHHHADNDDHADEDDDNDNDAEKCLDDLKSVQMI